MSRKTTQAQTVTPAISDVADDQIDQTPEATPAEAKPPKLTPAERKAQRLAAEAKIRAEGGVVKNAAGRPTARNLTCLCGCGKPTHTDEAWFLSGHDAKLRKAIVDGKLTIEQVPEIVRPFFRLGSPIAGLLLEDDGTFTDTKVTR